MNDDIDLINEVSKNLGAGTDAHNAKVFAKTKSWKLKSTNTSTHGCPTCKHTSCHKGDSGYSHPCKCSECRGKNK